MLKKKYSSTIHIIIFTAFFSIGFAQNPEWINYTNGSRVDALIEDGDNIWAGTDGGLVKINKTSGQTIFYNTTNSGLPDNYVASIAIDGNGNKWIGTGWFAGLGGLASFDGTNWTAYTTSNSGLTDNWVRSIVIDGNGTKWIGTYDGGLASFNGINWTVYTTSNSGLLDNYVNSIVLDGSGTKWIGTVNGGLASFNGNNWAVYTNSNSGLPSNNISSIAIDNAGNKWIGTYSGGLVVYNEGGVLSVEPDREMIVEGYFLHQNYPNPFNPTTTIHYELPQKSNVQITIYDLLGRQINNLIKQTQDAGYKSVIWDATNDQGQPVSAGMYFCQVRVYDPDGIGAGEFVQTKKMILLR